MSDCDHDFETVDVQVSGYGFIETNVVLECQKCGGIALEKREFLGEVDD